MVYHASLRQTTQFFDDLSMLLLGTSFLMLVYTTNQPRPIRNLLSAIIFVSISTISIIYVRSGNLLIHTYSFITILMLIWPRMLYLIQIKSQLKKNTSSLRHDTPDSSGVQNRSGAGNQEYYLIWRLAKAGIYLVVAFVLWNIDLEMCLELRQLRKSLGLPWAWLFELHGWWHILTAAAAYEFMELGLVVCS